MPLVQVGVRSISSEEIDLIERTPRIKTFLAASILDPSGPYEGRAARWIPEVVAACSGPVYLTFDCDGLDASLVPALGTPEPGGLGWYDTLALITALANGPGIVGMDISEIAPIEGFVAPQFCIARLIYRMLGRIRAVGACTESDRDRPLRINKFFTEQGLCSRREADRLIAEGRVTINGRTAKLGDQVTPSDVVARDGTIVSAETHSSTSSITNRSG